MACEGALLYGRLEILGYMVFMPCSAPAGLIALPGHADLHRWLFAASDLTSSPDGPLRRRRARSG